MKNSNHCRCFARLAFVLLTFPYMPGRQSESVEAIVIDRSSPTPSSSSSVWKQPTTPPCPADHPSGCRYILMMRPVTAAASADDGRVYHGNNDAAMDIRIAYLSSSADRNTEESPSSNMGNDHLPSQQPSAPPPPPPIPDWLNKLSPIFDAVHHRNGDAASMAAKASKHLVIKTTLATTSATRNRRPKAKMALAISHSSVHHINSTPLSSIQSLPASSSPLNSSTSSTTQSQAPSQPPLQLQEQQQQYAPIAVGDLLWYSATLDPDLVANSHQAQQLLNSSLTGKSLVMNGYEHYLVPDLAVQMYDSQTLTTTPSTTTATTMVASSSRVQKKPPSWGLDRIDQRSDKLDNEYHYPALAGENTTIYIIDTGVNIEHVDFEGRASHGPVFVSGSTDPTDRNGHGSFVAAVAAGTSYGVAKKARIVSLKALDDVGAGRLSTVLAAIEWVVRQHVSSLASTSTFNSGNTSSQAPHSIINLSLGAERNEPTNIAIQEAMRLGIHFAIAAGNDGKDACQFSPASVPGAMTVGATDKDDTIATFSNHGPCVAVYAPGMDIVSAWTGSKTARHVQSGTSMASPHVAGLMALILSDGPTSGISVNEMTRRILGSVTRFSIDGALVPDDGVTIEVAKALMATEGDHGPFADSQGNSANNVNNKNRATGSEQESDLSKLKQHQYELLHGKVLAKNLLFVDNDPTLPAIEDEDSPLVSSATRRWPNATLTRNWSALLCVFVAALFSIELIS